MLKGEGRVKGERRRRKVIRKAKVKKGEAKQLL